MSFLPLPKTQTLSALTAQALKKGFGAGRWRINLPGERELAQELQVSRAILRGALRILEREGFIRKSARHKTRIVKRVRTGQKTRSTVVFLSPAPPVSSISLLHHLQQVVQKAGLFPLDQVAPELEKPGVRAFLQKITARDDVACWVLGGTNRLVQRYFEERKIPSLVSGHRYPGVSLPSIDLDNRAIVRHATGLLLARGHRRLGLILYNRKRAGDKATVRGFEEALAAHRPISPALRGISSDTRTHEQLDRLFQRRDYPTGLVVMHPFSVVAVVSHLYLRGFRIPEDVSIISFLNHPVLKSLPIRMAHYSTASFFRQTAAAVLRQAGRASFTGKEKLIESDFIEGKSLISRADEPPEMEIKSLA